MNGIIQHLIVLRRARRRAPNLTRSDRLLCSFGSLFLNPKRIRKRAIALRPSTLLAFIRRWCVASTGCVLSEFASEEARIERAGRGSHPGHCRTQVAQSSIRLSTECAHHRAGVRNRHRQERRAPRVGQTLSPGAGRDRTFVVVVSRPHGRQPLQRRPLSLRIDRAPELLGTRGHGPVTRRIVGIGVHCGAVTGADGCRMFNTAIHGQGVPRHLSTDHDPVFEAHRWEANLRILEIDEIKTVPHAPLSHPFVERLIGATRRDFLDHVLFWNARDLERKIADFQLYYNAARSHASLNGRTPLTFVSGHAMTSADLNHVRWVSHCRDLFQLPVAA